VYEREGIKYVKEGKRISFACSGREIECLEGKGTSVASMLPSLSGLLGGNLTKKAGKFRTKKISYRRLQKMSSGDLELLTCIRVIKISPKGALGSHEIRPIHSAPSLGQSID